MAKSTLPISGKAANNPGPDRTARVQRLRSTPTTITTTHVIRQEKAR